MAHTAVSEITQPLISLIITAASYEKYLVHISPNCHRRKPRSSLKPLFPPDCCCCLNRASSLSPPRCCNLQDHFERPTNGWFGWSLIINQKSFPLWKSIVNIVLTNEKLGVGVRAEVKAFPFCSPCSYIQNLDPIDCMLLFVRKLCSDWHFLVLSRLQDELNLRISPHTVYWATLILESQRSKERHTLVRHAGEPSREVVLGLAGWPWIDWDRVSWPPDLLCDAWDALGWVSVFQGKFPVEPSSEDGEPKGLAHALKDLSSEHCLYEVYTG